MRESYEITLRQFMYPQFKPARKVLGWTQARMAEALMMDVRSYCDLEHGKSGCSALTLALFLIQVCADPSLFLHELTIAFRIHQDEFS